ncbi:MAG: T9SS type A sorting domain-containing protein [Flavobacteriales bacterium]
MNKLFLLLIALTLTSQIALSQIVSASAIKHSSYLQDPQNYTSKIDSNKIKSKILIDRSFYTNLILNVNGTNKVTTITSGNWGSIYEALKNANSDTSFFPSANDIEYAGIELKTTTNTYPLALLNIDFKRIKETAMINGDFSEGNDFLQDIKATSNSFETVKAFAGASIFSNIFGDDVYFTIPNNFIFNNTKEIIDNIEIDFGNGLGYQSVNTNESIPVHYSNTNNEFIEIKIKARSTIGNATPQMLHTHFTIFRKSSSSIKIPSPSNQNILGDNYNFKYYPNSDNKKIEYNILFNPNNSSGKLRRPFIMCDGFDYGNKRNFSATEITALSVIINSPEDNDTRGLFDILNGTPSPWSQANEKHPNLVDSLFKYGYDLVFVNFIEGAGDILANAANLRGFLNTVINNELRDDFTEENTIVGPSMGGLITRIALKQMENANVEHFVKIWISFDSPHKGANIPISLQHNINYACNFAVYGSSFAQKRDLLNSTAAKQLLIHHYRESNGKSNPSMEHTQLMSYLDDLGYPSHSKNIAISNGGKQILYSPAGIQIVKFNLLSNTTYLKGWGQNNSNGTYILSVSNSKEASEQTVKSESQIPMDNSPGGWHGSPNSINFSIINEAKNELDKSNVNNKWACFIPTSSAFGQDITTTSVHRTWESYTNCNDNTSGKIKTPFDEIHGMETNEEHVKISAATAEYVLDEFQEYMKSTIRPVVRSGNAINQMVKGKVAYLVIDTIQLASTGNGNTYTLKETSEVNLRAGKSIQFHKGFKAVAGSKMSAKIAQLSATPYYTTAGNYKSAPVQNANPASPSPFLGKVYDYSTKENIVKAVSDNVILNVFPNPAENTVSINIEGLNGNTSTLEIFNALGTTMFKEVISNNGTYKMDISSLESGVYFFKVKSDNSEAYQRVVKL